MNAPTPSTKVLKIMTHNFKVMEMNPHLIFTKDEILCNRPIVQDESGEFVRGEPLDDDNEDDAEEMTFGRRSQIFGELKTKLNKFMKEKTEKLFAYYDKIHGNEN